MTKKVVRKEKPIQIGKEQLHYLVDRLSEHDILLAYNMLRRMVASPGVDFVAEDRLSTPSMMDEKKNHNSNDRLFEDPALDQAFDYVLDNYEETIKNLVKR
ncbi:hypothetical protein [Ammoniphilus sp. YIM 78166]|uniref:hypothetical protein n=1 Tax=Ammoniphilus sp. YIM 78166 TaxID=1644106 RepID=UPI00106F672F|nr:hypothetical protein [Ammoniphilus sp. YIM 78166]